MLAPLSLQYWQHLWRQKILCVYKCSPEYTYILYEAAVNAGGKVKLTFIGYSGLICSVFYLYMVTSVVLSAILFYAYAQGRNGLCTVMSVPCNICENCKLCIYRSGTVNSKSFIGKVFLWIKWKFELNTTL